MVEGVSVVLLHQVGEVKGVNHESEGEIVVLSQLPYDALIVMVCPASILEGVVVIVHAAVPGVVHSVPEQSNLQCPGVPLSSPSSQTSSGSNDQECHSITSPSTSIPSVSSSSTIPSQHLAI